MLRCRRHVDWFLGLALSLLSVACEPELSLEPASPASGRSTQDGGQRPDVASTTPDAGRNDGTDGAKAGDACNGHGHTGDSGTCICQEGFAPPSCATCNSVVREGPNCAPAWDKVKFVDMSAGFRQTCGLTSTGAIWCWGSNQVERTGIATISTNSAPMQVGNDDEWASLSVSYREWNWARSCGIKKDGSLWCWSTLVRGLDEADKEFAVRAIEWVALGIQWFDRGRPVRVDDSANWAHVATGRHGYFGVTKDGNVARWIEGQRPVFDYASGKVKQLSVGESVAYIVSPLGEIRASSDGADSLAVIPSQAASTSWTKISVGGESHVCGIQKSGVLSCWGTAHPYGSTMQTFGNPSHRWKDVAAGREHTCAVRQDGTVWCWGSNGNGALGTGDLKYPGNGTTDPFSVLVRVGQESDFVQVVSGHGHSCARRENGRIVCWGYMADPDDLGPRFAP